MTSPPSLARATAAMLAAAVAAALAGCANAPATQFHTLLEGADAPAVPPADGLRFRIDSPLVVPAEVDQPQMVVRQPDGSVTVLEQQRWVAPLADEWRDAVSDAITRQSGALDVSTLAPDEALAPSVRLRLQVQRFDSEPGRRAVQQVLWTLRRGAGAPAALTCRSIASEPVANSDAAALAAAHRAALARIASGITRAMQALQAGTQPACP